MRRVIAPVAALAVLLLSAAPALADGGGGNGSASAGAGGITVSVGTDGSPGKSGGGGAPTPDPSCGLVYVDGHDMPSLVDNSTQGYWVINTCTLGTDPKALQWVPTTPGGPQPVASVVAETALSKAAWPTIKLTFNPSKDRLLVNFPTWLHVGSGWRTITATASVAGVSATVNAKPEWVRWDMGDGAVVTCHSAGTAYDPNLPWQTNLDRRDCGHTYASSSASQPASEFQVRVTIHYGVTWTTTTGGGGSLGSYDRSASTSAVVGQVESLEN